MLGGDYLRFVLLVQFQESKTLLTLGTCLPPLFIRNAVCAYVCSYSCVRCVCVCVFVSVCVWVVVHVHGFRLFLETLGFLRRAFQQETELRARVYRFEPSSASSFSFFFLSLSFFVSLGFGYSQRPLCPFRSAARVKTRYFRRPPFTVLQVF